MPDLSELTADQLTSTCRESAAALAETLQACFGYAGRIEPGTASTWSSDAAPLMLETPGLAVVFEVGAQALLCLIPESLILPDWYEEPGESEAARLQTLAMEWSQTLLPLEFEPKRFESLSTVHLRGLIDEARPADEAVLLELQVFPTASDAERTEEGEASAGDAEAHQQDQDTPETDEEETSEPDASDTEQDSGEETPPVATLYVMWPVTVPPSRESSSSEPDSEPAPRETPAAAAESEAPRKPATAETPVPQTAPQAKLSAWLTNVPVTVSVRLAEKKVEVDQLLSITPGSLITFSRSCEELLELYVNNQLYARGEAVKIGEKFGLKINEIGPSPEPQQDRVILG